MGRGSTFSFTMHLPLAKEQPAGYKDQSTENTPLHLKILVAEDNEINKIVLQKQLERLNVHAVIVSNGVEAYNSFVADDFDAILLDLDMPQQDGYETIKKIRELAHPMKSQAHVIAFTASVTEQDFIISSGFNDHLYKPVNMQDLREKLQKIHVRADSEKNVVP